MAVEFAGDYLHPVAAAESVVEAHALQGIGLAGAAARNGCQSVDQNGQAPGMGRRLLLWQHRVESGIVDGYCRDFGF